MHIECPHCDAPLDAETNAEMLRCGECAQEFSSSAARSVQCPTCGAALEAPAGAAVILCGECGHRIELAAPEPPLLDAEPTSTPIMTIPADEPSEKAGATEETSFLDGEQGLERQRLASLQNEFGGNYEIIEPIGQGGMGAVYKARQKKPSRIVVLKVMLNGRFASRKYRQRFAREAQAVARLKNPGIVAVYEYGEVSGQPYFTMEYVEGCNIREYVRKHNLDKRQVCELVMRVSRSVAYAHQRGVIHRDLKPSNILVDAEGNPRLLDFGLARLSGDASEEQPRMSEAGEVMGTPSYMSPEQTVGRPEGIDVRTDVYSIGVLFYELLTDSLPYRIDRERPLESLRIIRDYVPRRPSSVNPKLDGDLDAIVMKCLEKEREQRYQSAVELGEDVNRYLRGHPVEARPTTTFYHLRKLIWRHRSLFLPIAAFIVVGLAVMGVFMLWLARARLKAQKVALDADTAVMQAGRQIQDLRRFIMDLQSVRLTVERLMAEGRWEEAYRVAAYAERELPPEAGLTGLAAEVRDKIAGSVADAEAEVSTLINKLRFRDARERLQRLKELAGQLGLTKLSEQMAKVSQEFDEACWQALFRQNRRSARALQRFLVECPGNPHAPEVRQLLEKLLNSIRFTKWPLDLEEARRNQRLTAEVLELPIRHTMALPGGASMEFMLVPAGKFVMGTARQGAGFNADQKPEHSVRFMNPLYVAATEVTREQFEAVTGMMPAGEPGPEGRDMPVAVSWEAAQTFCTKLSLLNRDRLTVRLPTEAEWEYACAAGSDGPYAHGIDGPDELDQFAWYRENSGGRPQPVGTKGANAWGLHDMHGNMLEWCRDWYGARYYLSSPLQEPRGPDAGIYRVLRGGSWSDGPEAARSAFRSAARPDSVRPTYGFRPTAEVFTDRPDAVASSGGLMLLLP